MSLNQTDTFTSSWFEKNFKDLISFAIRAQVIEPSDLLAFVIDHEVYDRADSAIGAGAGWQKELETRIVDQIIHCAYQGRHCPGGQDIHAVLSRKADKYFADR